MSKEVLGNYLSRAVSHAELGFSSDAEIQEDVRMFLNMGAKFIGRAVISSWSAPDDEDYFRGAKEIAEYVHSQDSEIILQGGIFECVVKRCVDIIPIPAWVFEEFGLPAEARNFIYEAMLGDDESWIDVWGEDGSVPDLTKIETQMFMYYLARNYIDAGFEALHMGQWAWYASHASVELKTEFLRRIRDYAIQNARRKWVLLDAHVHGQVGSDGVLLFDFHAMPLRLREMNLFTNDNALEYKWGNPRYWPREGNQDSIYGRSLGGRNPNGWDIKSNFFIAEVDNWGNDPSKNEYDEITWFASLNPAQRICKLASLNRWIRKNYEYGYLQMPTKRWVAPGYDMEFTLPGYDEPVLLPGAIYRANRHADGMYNFDLEDTIKAIWENPLAKHCEHSGPCWFASFFWNDKDNAFDWLLARFYDPSRSTTWATRHLPPWLHWVGFNDVFMWVFRNVFFGWLVAMIYCDCDACKTPW